MPLHFSSKKFTFSSRVHLNSSFLSCFYASDLALHMGLSSFSIPDSILAQRCKRCLILLVESVVEPCLL